MRVTRRIGCTGCGATWDAANARFCGRCGARLTGSGWRPWGRADGGHPGDDRRHRTVRAALVVAGAAGVVLIAAAVITGTIRAPFPGTTEPDAAVTLPEPPEAPAELTPEQREALERVDPDRVRCEPHGCEVTRLILDEELTLAAVGHGWLVVLDGTTLRVRALPAHDGETDHEEAPADPEGTGADTTPDPDDATTDPHEAIVRPTPAADVTGGGGFRRPWREPTGGDPVDGGYDLDLSRWLAGQLAQDDRPTRLAVAADGSVVVLWPHRFVVFDPAGEERWRHTEEDTALRFANVIGEHLVTLRSRRLVTDEDGATTTTAAPYRVAVHDLSDGAERWRRDVAAPVDLSADLVVVSATEGTIERLHLDDGTTAWRRELAPSERFQATSGPWLVLGHPEGVRLVDAVTGRETSRPQSALLTPFSPVDGLWVAAWLEGTFGAADVPQVVLVATDADGEERWRVRLPGLRHGRCCPAPIPWLDGTVAVFDPAAPSPGWFTVDAAAGTLRQLPEEDQPHLPFPVGVAERTYTTRWAEGRLIQQAEDRLGVLAAEGTVRVVGTEDLEVLSLDPVVVAQGRQVLAARLVPLHAAGVAP